VKSKISSIHIRKIKGSTYLHTGRRGEPEVVELQRLEMEAGRPVNQSGAPATRSGQLHGSFGDILTSFWLLASGSPVGWVIRRLRLSCNYGRRGAIRSCGAPRDGKCRGRDALVRLH
jgi:hypothetical protein